MLSRALTTAFREQDRIPDIKLLVWYGAYGSNLLNERFMCYLQGTEFRTNTTVIKAPPSTMLYFRLLISAKDSSLEYVSSYAERKSIYLRAWSGCLEASKALRERYVAERNVNGSTKREEVFTAKMREDEFVQIAKIHDPIYEAGVKAAVLWELKVIGFSGKKIYLDGVPKQSVVWNYIKDKNKKIISDIETTNENTQD